MARLKCLRFIPYLPLDGGKRMGPAEGAASYLRTMGPAGPVPGHCRPRFLPTGARGTHSHGFPDRARRAEFPDVRGLRSEEHTSELQSLMRISYAVFCLKKKKQ